MRVLGLAIAVTVIALGRPRLPMSGSRSLQMLARRAARAAVRLHRHDAHPPGRPEIPSRSHGGQCHGRADVPATPSSPKGGAFRSRGKWYALTYSCTATPDHMAVAFHYTIGAEIPETKWAGYGLHQ